MKNVILYLFILLVITSACSYEEPIIDDETPYYQKFIGGAFQETVKETLIDENGNVLAMGDVQEGQTNESDIYLFQASEQGVLIWETKLGEGAETVSKDLVLTADGHLLVLGYITQNGNQDILVYKTDMQGAIVDSVVIGSEGQQENPARIIELTDGSGYMIGALVTDENGVQSNVIYKVNPQTYEVLWEESYEGRVRQTEIAGMVELEGNHLLWTGSTVRGNGTNEKDVTICVLSENGSISEASYFGQLSAKNENIVSINKVADKWFLTGSIEDVATSEVKSFLLPVTYGNGVSVGAPFIGENVENVLLNDIVQSSYNTILATGLIETGVDNNDIYICEFSFAGDLLWENIYGGAGNDEGKTIHALPEGDILVLGDVLISTNTSLTILKTDQDGNLIEE